MSTKSFHHRDLGLNPNPLELKPLFQIQSMRHAWAILMNWALIIGAIAAWSIFPSIGLYTLCVIIIGARMHGLAILMHDATHYRFLKNRYWNDLLTNLLTMYPLFSSIEKYRSNHLAHHQHLNTEEDPDWVAKLGKRSFTFPQSKARFIIQILSYFFLYQGIADAIWFIRRLNVNKEKDSKNKEPLLPMLLYYTLLAGGLTYFGGWQFFLMFWVVPWLSTFYMFQYIRSVAEHFGQLSYDNLLTSTRTVKTNALERFFIAPHNVAYHLEHHLYPGVPFYNLSRLHSILMKIPEYREKAHITQGYLKGLFQEFSSHRS